MPMGIGPGLSVTRFESGIPGWMTGMDLGWDFTQNVQYSGATNPTDTHSATIYAQSSSGVWSPFAANTLVRTDLGLQTVPTRVQLINNSTTISTSFFINTGCTAVENATGPGGSVNGATTITSSGVGDNRRQRNFAVANDNTRYTFQVFIAKTSSAPTYYPAVLLSLLGGSSQQVVVAVVNPHTGTVTSTGSAGFTATVSSSGAFWVVSTSVANNTSGNVTLVLQLYPSYNTDGTTTQNFSANGATVFAWPTAVAADFTYPIPNSTNGSVTVNGNQQVVDLTGRLSAGVGVIFQFNPLDITATFKCPLTFNNGTGNNLMLTYMTVGGGTVLSQIYNGGINQGNVNWPGANATGVQTWVWVAGPDYHRAQKIGFAASSTDTTVSWPTLTRMSIGGTGYNAGDNMYQLTRRIGLKFGTANDAMFNELVSKATILAAVS